MSEDSSAVAARAMSEARAVIAREIYGRRAKLETSFDIADSILSALKDAGYVVVPREQIRLVPLGGNLYQETVE